MDPVAVTIAVVAIGTAAAGTMFWASRQVESSTLVPGPRRDPLRPRRRDGPVVPLPTGGQSVLRDRWKTQEGRAIAVEAARWLAGMHPAPPPELGRHEGRIDLRGFRLPDPPRISPDIWIRGDRRYSRRGTYAIFQGVTWSSIDFSDAVMRDVELVGGEVRDCLFDEADMDQFRGIGVGVIDSSFRRADLSDLTLVTAFASHPASATIRGCFFEDARLSRAWLGGVSIASTTFRGALLVEAQLWGNSYDKVVFDGDFSTVKFSARTSPRGHDGAPERQARMDLGEARHVFPEGYRLDDVTLPHDESARRIRQAALVLSRIRDDDETQSRWAEMHLATVGDGDLLLDRSSPWADGRELDAAVAAAQRALGHPVHVRSRRDGTETWSEIVGEQVTRRVEVSGDRAAARAPEGLVVGALEAADNAYELVDAQVFERRWASSVGPEVRG